MREVSFFHLIGKRDLGEFHQDGLRTTVEGREGITGADHQARREDGRQIGNADHLGAADVAPFNMAVIHPALRNAGLVDRDGRAQEPVVADDQHQRGPCEQGFDAETVLHQRKTDRNIHPVCCEQDRDDRRQEFEPEAVCGTGKRLLRFVKIKNHCLFVTLHALRHIARAEEGLGPEEGIAAQVRLQHVGRIHSPETTIIHYRGRHAKHAGGNCLLAMAAQLLLDLGCIEHVGRNGQFVQQLAEVVAFTGKLAFAPDPAKQALHDFRRAAEGNAQAQQRQGVERVLGRHRQRDVMLVREPGTVLVRPLPLRHDFGGTAVVPVREQGSKRLLRAIPHEMYGGDIMNAFDSEAVLQQMQEDIVDPAFFKGLVEELLANTTRLDSSVLPDPDYFQKRKQIEEERLATLQASLPESEKERIRAESAALLERQRQPVNNDLLPRIHPSDVSATSPAAYPLPADRNGTMITPIASNGIAYARVLYDVTHLPEEAWPWLQLYVEVVPELGVAGRTYEETDAWRHKQVPFFDINLQVTQGQDDRTLRIHADYYAKGLREEQRAIAEVLSESIRAPRFDELERLAFLIDSKVQDIRDGLADEGDDYARYHHSSRTPNVHPRLCLEMDTSCEST